MASAGKAQRQGRGHRPRPAAAVPLRAANTAAAPLSPEHARKVRIVAATLIVTMPLWMFLNWAGSFYGWPIPLAFCFDIIAFAAFGWALFTAYRIWRERSPERAAGSASSAPRRNTRI